MASPNCPVPGRSLLCAACGGDTSTEGGGVLTLSVRKIDGDLEVKHVRYHKACVPREDKQVHMDLEKLGTKAELAVGPEPERGVDQVQRERAKRTVSAPVALEKVGTDGVITLVTAEGAPKYKLVAEFQPGRGFATVIYNELHAMWPLDLPLSAAQMTQRLLDNGEYHRTAPKAAQSKDPVKPVTTVLEGWVAEGKVTRG
jgi:hypothetical protein